MSETLPPSQQTETPPSKEVTFDHQFAALHPRLLLTGDALNPDKKDLPKAEILPSFENRDYTIYSQVSLNERVKEWEGRENNDFERQKQAWVENTVATFEQGKKFFTESEQGKQWTQVFSSLGIDAKNFTADAAKHLYAAYLEGGVKEQKLKDFVKDIINSSSFNMADLDAVAWIGNIFGKSTNVVIQHLIYAEQKLRTEPNSIIENANESQTPEKLETLRINKINETEEAILHFIWGNGQAQIQSGETPKPTEPGQDQTNKTPQERRFPIRPAAEEEGYKWDYYSPGDPRKLPKENLIEQLLDPTALAQELKNNNPNKYNAIPNAELAKQIADEQELLNQELSIHGITLETIANMGTRFFGTDFSRDYEAFLKEEYGINVPKLGNVRFQPIFGKTVESFGIGRGTFAFVDPSYPVIFLNMNEIAPTVQQLHAMSPDTVKQTFERVLGDIAPHEKTHLIGDLAFWRQIKTLPDGGEDVKEILPGKTGIKVGKPVKYQEGEQIKYHYKERGRWLSEAVTVELTNKWAESRNAKIELNAYPAEQQVLNALLDTYAKDHRVSQSEAFKQFAKAYFDPKEFRKLVIELSRAGEQNQLKRPHFVSIIYGLMEYENKKHKARGGSRNYDLTLHYIYDQVTPVQKAEILRNITLLELSPAAEEDLKAILTSAPKQKAA